ncbi:hypothetical protein PR048_011403 [Dryococelus australis]|uniref:Integrase catalytic domain-containing protein n=1 Tax=Dryococelus australis TaxID=614101 RepID=A0ABQ9HLK3_9NEOP|nr:hypothetical protein PR048_011403 [Dryococelus australis]
MTSLPRSLWLLLGIDIFEIAGLKYIVIQDYFSRFFELVQLPNSTLTTVITRLKNIFDHHGIPEEVRTDGGTQFTSSEFQKFAKTQICPIKGEAESVVKIAKNNLSKSADPNLGLLTYRATPLESRLSPAELWESTKNHVARERVWIPDMKHDWKIHAYRPFPRLYIVQTWQGQMRRNRVQLIPLPEGSRLDGSFHGAPEMV